MDIAHVGFGNFQGTEKIMAVCGASSNDTFYSLNGGVSWTQDTTANPTFGLECNVWCPSVGQGSNFNQPGIWAGLDSALNLYISTSSNGLSWFNTTENARYIFRTEEWAGYGNNSDNTTWFQFTGAADSTAGGFARTRMGVTWQGARPLFQCNVANVRARYQWGNGVIMFDRAGDTEFVVGRYGPIKP
jgi:hypothetical protein